MQLPPDPPSNQRGGSGIPGRPDASIVNKGTITASSRGFAALVAPDARNSGTVTATLGTVPLAAGNSFTLDMYGDKLITLAVGDSIAAKVINVATGKRVPVLEASGLLSRNRLERLRRSQPEAGMPNRDKE